ncbi:hypothetical protein N656DRAFT_64314 [Canariomyces notabilis]|uniref:Uncharacterized protein n=1 Tax=Canariomyces notabilis TaxID=2074819 RepID=A0AAN6YXX4_9PEZI|nr:hypothetical protein N656DRAFT_64314 [Canariomyces arenarius]
MPPRRKSKYAMPPVVFNNESDDNYEPAAPEDVLSPDPSKVHQLPPPPGPRPKRTKTVIKENDSVVPEPAEPNSDLDDVKSTDADDENDYLEALLIAECSRDQELDEEYEDDEGSDAQVPDAESVNGSRRRHVRRPVSRPRVSRVAILHCELRGSCSDPVVGDEKRVSKDGRY